MTALRLPLPDASEPPPEKAAELTKRLRDALRMRYAWPEWALLEEINLDSRGLSRYSIADAIAFGMWGSSHYAIHGFEIKSTRSDWLREVREIGKADAAYRYCHRWWLVAPESIIDPAEIPGTWGWLIPRGTTLRVKRQAPAMKPEALSQPAVSHVVRVAIDRGLQRTGDESSRLRAEFQRGMEEGVAQEARRYRPGELEELRTAVDRFQEASGITITNWSGAQVGKAVKFVERGGLKRQEEQLAYAARYVYEALVALSHVVPTIKDRGGYGQGVVDLAGMLAPAAADEDDDI